MKTAHLYISARPKLRQIIHMPFNQQLMQGTLPIAQFAFYLRQDALYLRHYAKALKNIANRATDKKMHEDFNFFSHYILSAELSLHKYYFKHYNIVPTEVASPTCAQYYLYLLNATKYRPLEEAIASILPCFWVYKEVGSFFANNTVNNNPYKIWINTYSNADFIINAQKMTDWLEYYINEKNIKIHNNYAKVFHDATHFEWQFWDSAYHLGAKEHLYTVQKTKRPLVYYNAILSSVRQGETSFDTIILSSAPSLHSP